MKKFRILVALMALALVVAAVLPAAPALAQDGGDDEAPRATLSILLDGDEREDFFFEDINGRIYGFNGSAGDVVSISMVSEDLDPYLVLLGPFGEVYAYDDDGGEEPLSSLIEFELPNDGSYFIFATTFSGRSSMGLLEEDDDPLAYTIAISGNTLPEEIDPEVVQFFRGDLVFGESITGYSNLSEPVYYWAFDAEAGQIVNITVESDDFDTLLYVFGVGGDRIAANDDADGTNSAIEGLEIPEDGRYIVWATQYSYTYAAEAEDDEDYGGGDFIITLTEQ